MKTILRHLSAGAIAGFLIGGLWALAESLALMNQFSTDLISNPEILRIFVIYSVHWCLIIGVVGFLVGIIRVRKPSVFKVALLGYMLLSVLGMIYVFCFFKITTSWVTNLLSFQSLIANISLIVAVLLGLVAIIRYVPRLSPRVGIVTFAIVFLLWGSLLITTLALGAQFDEEETRIATKPDYNVLFLLVDTLRADHLGCHGYGEKTGFDTTPFLDELAGQGVRFENCISSSSWTRPATASLLSGMFVVSHNQKTLFSVLPGGSRLIPDAMDELGYRTAFVTANTQVSRAYGFARDVDFYRGLGGEHNCSFFWFAHAINAQLQKAMKKQGAYSTYLIQTIREMMGDLNEKMKDAGSVSENFLTWLDEEPDRPFFAYLHYMDPHAPYVPRPPFKTRFVDPAFSGPLPKEPPSSMKTKEIPPLISAEPLDPPDRKALMSQYDGEIASFDAYLGDLLKELKNRNLFDNTLIVFTSDHGEMFFDHGAWKHGHSLFQELIHVPLIFKFPGNQYAGTVVRGMSRHVDVIPTLLDLLGQEPWPQLQGQSLASVMRGEQSDWAGYWALSETSPHGYYITSYIDDFKKIIRIREEKGEDHWYLYDLLKDPGETVSIYDQEQSLARKLEKEMDEKLEILGNATFWEADVRTVTEEDKERLRALGYGK